MAENEGMEGKDLAQEERNEVKEQEEFLEAVKKLKDGQTEVSPEGLVVAKIKGQYTISMRGITFAIVDENGNFKYNEEKMAELEKTLKEEGLEINDLKLTDLEQALAREKETKIEEPENEENPQDGEDRDEEKGDEKPELENDAGEEIDKKTQEIAERYNVSAEQVIHIAKNKKITDKNFGQIAKWAENYDDIFILPGDDEYSKKFIGVKNGEQEEIKDVQKQIGGKNPDILIKRIDGRTIEEIKPICMYELDDKSAIAIVKDEYGRPEALYCRQEGGDKKTFWGTVIPEANGKNVLQQEPKTRDFMDYKNNSSEDFSKKAEALERQKDLEYRGLPSKEDGVQLEEIDGSPRENREINVQDIEAYLMSRDGIIDKMTVPPGYYEDKAKKVLALMEDDEDLQFDDAVEQIENESQREAGGRTPEKLGRREF